MKSDSIQQVELSKTEIKRKYAAVCIGVVLVYSGFSSMLILQSSINIVGGLGSKATAVGYVTSLILCLFFAPFFLRLVGVKRALIASEIAYIMYVIANFYPKIYVLLIGGVVVGFAEALFWVPMCATFVYFGKLYHQKTSKSEAACVSQFSGIMFGTYQLNMILGNTFVFGILQFLKTTVETSTNNSTLRYTENFGLNLTQPLLHCGANDCQDVNITMKNIDQYVPSSSTPVYILLSSFIVLMITGLMIHICFMPEMPLDYENKIQIKEVDFDDEVGASECLHADEHKAAQESNIKQAFRMSTNAVKDTFHQLRQFNQLLLIPATIYYGLNNAFVYSDLTRAYASCINGVSKVGICIIIFASVNSLSCYVGGGALGKFGYQTLFLTGLLMDSLLYVVCLVWIPTPATSSLVYFLFAWSGITGAVWQLIITNIPAQLFYQNREVSFTVAHFGFCIGFSLQYAWSTALCVRTKIYILLGGLSIAILALEYLGYQQNLLKAKKVVKVEEQSLGERSSTFNTKPSSS